MRLSDFYTALRLALVLPFFALYHMSRWVVMYFPAANVGRVVSIASVLLFLFIACTDFLDGYYARKSGKYSSFGKVFDPFADVIANVTVMLCLVADNFMPVFLFLCILYREFGMMFLRMLACGEGHVVGAQRMGKLKTASYMGTVLFSLLLKALYAFELAGADWYERMRAVGRLVYVVPVVLALASFFSYLKTFFPILKRVCGRTRYPVCKTCREWD